MVNFFISYTSVDKEWAEWIAWQLEEHGYSTIIQEWDFRPGSDFVHQMQDASENSKSTIAVLSDAYLQADFTGPEWAAAVANDPSGRLRKLIPVRVSPCEPKGILKARIYIDLAGLDEKTARAELLKGIQDGRALPSTPPIFPNVVGNVRQKPSFPIKSIDVINNNDQHACLLVSELGLEYALFNHHDNRKNIKWVIPAAKVGRILACNDIYVQERYKKGLGLFSIGERRNWVYSHILFPRPEALYSDIKILLNEVISRS